MSSAFLDAFHLVFPKLRPSTRRSPVHLASQMVFCRKKERVVLTAFKCTPAVWAESAILMNARAASVRKCCSPSAQCAGKRVKKAGKDLASNFPVRYSFAASPANKESIVWG